MKLGGHWMAWALSLLIVLMWGGWRVLLLFLDVPAANIPLIDPAQTTTTLDYLMIATAGYWLGSSRGSAEKSAEIASR